MFQTPLGHRRFQIGFAFAEYILFKPKICIQVLYVKISYEFVSCISISRDRNIR